MRAAPRGFVIRLGAILCGLAAAGCGTAVPAVGPTERYRPPSLALVAIVDPGAGDAAAELRQLAAVIQAGVTPSETLVVTLLSGPPPTGTYVVRGGDSLSAIAGGLGLPLASLQDANPQLGPLAHRDWNRVYPGDRVTIPAAHGTAATAANAVVVRAPAGPAPPELVREPARPPDATTYQDAQYRRALAAARSANAGRIAAWRAAADRQLGPWQARVVARLGALAGSLGAAGPAGAGEVAAAVRAAANTLAGLPGRRVLLLLSGGRAEGAPGPEPASLAGIHLVLANAGAGTSTFASAATAAGATVTALDGALTELQLAAVVNG